MKIIIIATGLMIACLFGHAQDPISSKTISAENFDSYNKKDLGRAVLRMPDFKRHIDSTLVSFKYFPDKNEIEVIYKTVTQRQIVWDDITEDEALLKCTYGLKDGKLSIVEVKHGYIKRIPYQEEFVFY